MSNQETIEFEATFYEQVNSGGVSLNHLYMIGSDIHVMHAFWDEYDKPGYLRRTNAIYKTNDDGNILKLIDFHQSIIPDTEDWIKQIGWS